MIQLSNIQVTDSGTPTEPVTLTEIKDWISGLTGVTDFDSILTPMIKAARQDIENRLNVKIVNSSVVMYVDSTNQDELPVLPYALSLPATITINKIVKGVTDTLMVVDEDYFLNGSLSFVEDGKYKLEYSITGAVPETIKEAIKMLIAYRFANRGDNEKQMGIPDDIVSKIQPYQRIWL